MCVCVCRQKVGNKQGAKRSGEGDAKKEGATEKGEAAVTAAEAWTGGKGHPYWL